MAEIHVTGLKELGQFLDTLPEKLRKNVVRGALRKGMNEVKPAAQQGVHSISGLLAAGLKVGTRAKGGTVYATLKATGKHGYVARWVEYGTAAHTITAKDRKALSLGGVLFQSVQHPGARPKPFMRVALDTQASRAVVAAAEYMRERLKTKHGLDTADIVFDSDE